MTETMCAKEGCKEYCFTTLWCEVHNWEVIQDIRNSAVKLHVSREKQKLKAQILEMIDEELANLENVTKQTKDDKDFVIPAFAHFEFSKLKQKVEGL